MWLWPLKMPTQNLLRFLLLLMLMMRIVLATACCRYGSGGLVIKLNFCSDFEHKVWSKFWSCSSGKTWSWSLVSILLLVFRRGNEVESWSKFWSQVWSISKICANFWGKEYLWNKAFKSYGSYLSIGGNRDNISYKNKNITFLLSIIVCCQGHNWSPTLLLDIREAVKNVLADFFR